jgi:hypothetical protein
MIGITIAAAVAVVLVVLVIVERWTRGRDSMHERAAARRASNVS